MADRERRPESDPDTDERAWDPEDIVIYMKGEGVAWIPVSKRTPTAQAAIEVLREHDSGEPWRPAGREHLTPEHRTPDKSGSSAWTTGGDDPPALEFWRLLDIEAEWFHDTWEWVRNPHFAGITTEGPAPRGRRHMVTAASQPEMSVAEPTSETEGRSPSSPASPPARSTTCSSRAAATCASGSRATTTRRSRRRLPRAALRDGPRARAPPPAALPGAIDIALAAARAAGPRLTAEELRANDRVIYQGELRARTTLAGTEVEIVGHPDFLLPARDGYAIRDSKLNRSVSEYIRMQLLTYGWLYEQTTGEPPVALQVHSGSGEIFDVPYEGARGGARPARADARAAAQRRAPARVRRRLEVLGLRLPRSTAGRRRSSARRSA